MSDDPIGAALVLAAMLLVVGVIVGIGLYGLWVVIRVLDAGATIAHRRDDDGRD